VNHRTEAWWSWPVQLVVPAPRATHRIAIAAAPSNEEKSRLIRLDALADVASDAWTARDEDDVFDAIGTACARLGLNAHLGIADPTGTFLVVRRIILPAGGEEIERILGGTALGRRIALDVPTPYRRVFRDGAVERMVAPLLWVRLAVPTLGQDEAIAVARLIKMGAVALAPIVADGATLGVLTVWAPKLEPADLSIAQVLGRIAGGALAALRARR
jgi:hypothetical protein